jgi:hypothetical protein
MTTLSSAPMSIQTEPGSAIPLRLPASGRTFAGAAGTACRCIDPLREPELWDAIVARHPEGSFFHTSAWARVLHESYGHQPWYVVRTGPDERSEALPVMEVNSLLTGRRGVALPFTDECPPLGGTDSAASGALFQEVAQHGCARGWKYLELRGGGRPRPDATPSVSFYSHRLQLERSEPELLDGFEGAVRRGIRKAENAGLKVERRTSLDAMRAFYGLHGQTRRRHGVPPQPFRFFETICRHVIEAGHGDVFGVLNGPRLVAAAVFFFHGKEVIYKFGASDPAAQADRPNNLLMWEAIKWYAGRGFATMHFGRTSEYAAGLRRFKLGFGAQEQRLDYFHFNLARNAFVTRRDRSESWLSPFFRWLPVPLLRVAGKLVYPHLS